MSRRDADDWTIERWKIEPRLADVEFVEPPVEQSTPLWQDLTLASALALLCWAAATVVFR